MEDFKFIGFGFLVGMATCAVLLQVVTKPQLAQKANLVSECNSRLVKPRLTIDTGFRVWLYDYDLKTSTKIDTDQLHNMRDSLVK